MARGTSVSTLAYMIEADASGVVSGTNTAAAALTNLGNTSTRVGAQVQRAMQTANGAVNAGQMGTGQGRRIQFFQNLGFAMEDFMSQVQTMGIAGGMRAAGNNIGMMAAAFNPMAGAIAGIAAVSLPMLITRLTQSEDAIEKQIEAVDRLTAAEKRYGDQLDDIASKEKFRNEVQSMDSVAEAEKAVKAKQEEMDILGKQIAMMEKQTRLQDANVQREMGPVLNSIMNAETMRRVGRDRGIKNLQAHIANGGYTYRDENGDNVRVSREELIAEAERRAEVHRKAAIVSVMKQYDAAMNGGRLSDFLEKYKDDRAGLANVGPRAAWQDRNTMRRLFMGDDTTIDEKHNLDVILQMKEREEQTIVKLNDLEKQRNEMLEKRKAIEEKLADLRQQEYEEGHSKANLFFAEQAKKERDELYKRRERKIAEARDFIDRQKAAADEFRSRERYMAALKAKGADDPATAAAITLRESVRDEIAKIEEVVGKGNFLPGGQGEAMVRDLASAVAKDMKEIKELNDPLNNKVLAGATDARSAEGVSYMNRLYYGALVRNNEKESEANTILKEIRDLLKDTNVTFEIEEFKGN
jgi:hypothetical protein